MKQKSGHSGKSWVFSGYCVNLSLDQGYSATAIFKLFVCGSITKVCKIIKNLIFKRQRSTIWQELLFMVSSPANKPYSFA